MKILFAEDETDLREVVTAYLEYQGYRVDAVADGREAVNRAAADAYDAMVLDVMMPVMDGLTAMRAIRAAGNMAPAIFLTAKSQVADRVEGLDAGADDYLTKPFAMEELSARLRALGRRSREYGPTALSFANAVLDAGAAELRAKNAIALARREVRLLSCLIANASRALSTEELAREVWSDEEANEDTVWMYISFLRAKLQAVEADAVIDGERGQSFRLREISHV